ncbi:MAG: hypothetical protein M1298_04665 [Chloroflexi bacterium]|nr:hypothetical protein [Chloroflexota bacterium]
MLPLFHVVFTMDCLPAATSRAPGPRSWELSARAISGFCTALLDANLPVTLFLTPECAEIHGPLLEELAAEHVELGLLIHPQSLHGIKVSKHFGVLSRDVQHRVGTHALQRFMDVVGSRPQSVRPALFSANDESFAVLSSLGFHQSSASNPGRRIAKEGALWVGALPDAHYTSDHDRLNAGDLPLWELPVTSDALQEWRGRAPDLCIDANNVRNWHRPLIEAQLARTARHETPFRTLCFYTRNAFPYEHRQDPARQNLEELISYLGELEERVAIQGATLRAAHGAYRSQAQTSPIM